MRWYRTSQKAFGRQFKWVAVLIMLAMGPTDASTQGTGYEYIDIDNPFLRKIPIAIPKLIDPTRSGATSTAAAAGTTLLSEALEFTGYFRLIDRNAYLIDPQKPTLTINEINFNNWVGIGAELLVTGAIELKGDQLSLELRLFDTFKAQKLVGKKYQGKQSDLRPMIHRFCSEIIYYLTGNRGVFDSLIAFISTGSGNKEIYISEFDGRAPKRFTFNDSITISPAWSSDRQWLAFTSYKRGNPDIYIINLSNKEQYVIGRKGLNITPAWVPGQFALAATLSFAGDQEIYLLTGKGKLIKRLTKYWGSDVSPSWSPDGEKIAFVSNRSGSPQIYIKNVKTGRTNRVTYQGNYNTQPAWSPSGDRIVYTSLSQGRNDIFVTDLEGFNPIQLTQNSADNESPSWSPDGSLIAFSSSREGPNRIYVMTAYGTDQRRLLMLPGEQTNPRWSPSRIQQ